MNKYYDQTNAIITLCKMVCIENGPFFNVITIYS